MMRRSILYIFNSIFLILGFILIYNLILIDRIFPNQKIAGVDVSKIKKPEALNKISQIKLPEKVILKYESEKFEVSTLNFEAEIDFQKSVDIAFSFTRTGNYFTDLKNRIELIYKSIDTGLFIKTNSDKLSSEVIKISKKIDVVPVSPEVKIVDNKIEVKNGKVGKLVNQDLLKAEIGKLLSKNDSGEINIPVDVVDYTLNSNEIDNLKANAEKLIGKNLTFKLEFDSFNFDDNDLIEIVDPKDKYDIKVIEKIAIDIAKKINREPQSPKFEFKDGKVSEFEPSKDGLKLYYPDFKDAFIKGLDTLSNSETKNVVVNIPVKRTPPAITTDKINNLGIKELIGRGYSEFKGSIPTRIHNVNLAASKMDGVLIAPGETFSFNKSLGDVSRFTGYQAAYVIREGRTVLGDGGGVCQVSSTLFRAALNAGLPIVERKAHAYRVGYYEQGSDPGFDATVYAPSPDFKFKNDTPGNILIQTIVDLKKPSLVFELYGTSDGRIAEFSKPVVSNVINPGPDIYQDDPNLPSGTIRQTEHKAFGARVVFNYKVTRNEEVLIDQKFTSVYRPWPAIYLRGVGGN